MKWDCRQRAIESIWLWEHILKHTAAGYLCCFNVSFQSQELPALAKCLWKTKHFHTPVYHNLWTIYSCHSETASDDFSLFVFPSLKLSSQLADVKVCVVSNVIKSVTQSPQPVNIILVSDAWQEIEVNRFKTLPSQTMRLKPLAIINPLELWAPKDYYRDISWPH